MSFAKASKKQEDVKQGGSNHITTSGIYPISIIVPVVNVSKGGSASVDLYVEHLGQKQIVYGNLRVTNNDDSPNKIGAKIFNQMLIIAGIDSVADPIDAELPIGKKEAMKECSVLEDLADQEMLMRIQMEYSVYNGNIQEKKVIKSFFRASDKATAEEIVNGEGAGSGYERELKYVNNITFKDDLTEAVVKQWIADKRPEGTAGSGGGAAPSKAPSFGNKRFGKPAED
ncbi:MAG: hypothetical protein V3S69_03795 [Dehalococcoidales bacterium]